MSRNESGDRELAEETRNPQTRNLSRSHKAVGRSWSPSKCISDNMPSMCSYKAKRSKGDGQHT